MNTVGPEQICLNNGNGHGDDDSNDDGSNVGNDDRHS